MDGQEPREVSGLTTSLILAYVEREGGRGAVEEVLRLAGCEGEEAALRDEQRWFADRRRVQLFHAAARVLDDPEVARRIGSSAVDFSIGQTLKLALRNLGSPRLIYANIVRANAKFNTAHKMSMLDIGEGRARLRNVPAEHITYDPVDCQYNEGILSCVPVIFGLPRARVQHPVCISNGADECVFEVRWQQSRTAMPWALAGLGALALGIAVQALLVPAVVVAAAAAIVAARRTVQLRAAGREALEDRVEQQSEAAERMMTSLKDLVSELRLDEVLDKIGENAQAAISGAEFALLLREGELLRCHGGSALPPGHLEAIETWAARADLSLEGSTTIDDLRVHEALLPLADDIAHPVGALCVAPLVSRGEPLGALVATTTAVQGFLPRDVVQLESYAAQAAIALTNARLYEAQQELATEDPLTGLYNHRHFHETIERELDRCRRYGAEAGVAIFDLDGFKRINDREGHAEGDRVLRAVADGMRADGRRTDICFRIGGDEFALVMPGTGEGDVASAAERVAGSIDRSDPRISVSWGVASWPRDGLTKDALLAAADQAMYEMKRSRWDRVGRPEVAVTEINPIQDSRKAERLACTSRLSLRLAPLLDPEQIAATVVEELLTSFPYNLAEILRVDGRVLRSVAAGGPQVERLPALREWEQSLDEGICGRAARIGEPVVVADTAADPGFIGVDRQSEGRSELAVPIRVGGTLWGVLNVEHRHTDAFEPDDQLFAETVAAACGASLHRSMLYGELENAFTRTLAVLSDALEAKDAYTANHAREVGQLAEDVARRLGMDQKQVRDVGYAALLHDIGKIGVRSEILNKPAPLTEPEYEEMKQHTVVGARMLERIPFFSDVHPMVRSSHERWDGRGYPDGLRAEQIPLGARIIGACDAFHAMTSDRPYREALPVDEAREELRAEAGGQFDPEVIEILLELTADMEETPGQPPAALI